MNFKEITKVDLNFNKMVLIFTMHDGMVVRKSVPEGSNPEDLVRFIEKRIEASKVVKRGLRKGVRLIDVESGETYESGRDLARKLGRSPSLSSHILNRVKQGKKYKGRYYEVIV